jgi:hypothetical protein
MIVRLGLMKCNRVRSDIFDHMKKKSVNFFLGFFAIVLNLQNKIIY